MSAKPWSKSQAKNNRKFQAKLDRITNYLVNGDWHASYSSKTFADADEILNNVFGKGELPLFTLEFFRNQDGALIASREFISVDGSELIFEKYIVNVQPYERTFYMIGLDDNDLVVGFVDKGLAALNLSVLEGAEAGDEALLGIEQYTNILV